MKLQKIGGIAAIGLALVFVAYRASFSVVMPRLGISTLSDWNNAAKVMAAFGAAPTTYFLFKLLDVIGSICFFVMVIALQERLGTNARILNRILGLATAMACSVWIAAGTTQIIAVPAAISANDPSAFRAAIQIGLGLSVAGDHIGGWILLLTGIAAVMVKGVLPRLLSYFSILIGVLFILTFAVNELGLVAALLTIVWGLWLGAVMLRRDPMLRRARKAAA